MKHVNSHRIRLNIANTDELISFAACISDTVLKPLYKYCNDREICGYIGALDLIAEWTKEFYQRFSSKMKDWDSFEESADNLYNAVCWDDFVIEWANDRFNQFKSEIESNVPDDHAENTHYASSKIPRLIITTKEHKLSAVYSSIPIQIAHVDYDSFTTYPAVSVFEADAVANDLRSLFDPAIPQQRAIRKDLADQGF